MEMSMQLTKGMLTRIIKEELANVLAEYDTMPQEVYDLRQDGTNWVVTDQDGESFETPKGAATQITSIDLVMKKNGFPQGITQLVNKANSGNDEKAVELINRFIQIYKKK